MPSKKKPLPERMEFQYLDLATLKILPRNFKRHDIEATRKSIELYGMADPLGRNPKTGNTYDGNGTVTCLKEMHTQWLSDAKVKVPRNIVVEDLKWLVPVVDVQYTSNEEVAVAAALNRINELGGYDEAYMLEVLQDLKGKDMLEGTGYGDADLTALLKRFPEPKEAGGSPPTENVSKDANGPGMATSAPASSIKQIGLLFAPDKHKRFQELTIELSKELKKDNTSDTVLAALEYVHEALRSKTGSK